MKNNQKLKGKDLINIGIYAAIYCVLMTCIAMLGYIPIMMPMLTVIGPIILGVPMMLFYTKVKKFGMITIMATIVGIYLCVTGMGFWPIIFGVVFGFLADLVAKSGSYASVKKTILSYGTFCFSYDGTPVLNIPHLSLPLDGIIALVGPNGAGKSTFSRCLCGLEKKFKGQVKINGQLWKNRQLLKNCYMVMQDVNHQLFCETVADEVQLGMRSENRSDVERVLEMLDLSNLRERHPMSLSGGQKQRVAIASAILAGKEILIFDEPTSGLDFRHMEQTAALLSSLKGNQTVLIVTHDPELIQRCCDHIVCIENGTVI